MTESMFVFRFNSHDQSQRSFAKCNDMVNEEDDTWLLGNFVSRRVGLREISLRMILPMESIHLSVVRRSSFYENYQNINIEYETLLFENVQFFDIYDASPSCTSYLHVERFGVEEPWREITSTENIVNVSVISLFLCTPKRKNIDLRDGLLQQKYIWKDWTLLYDAKKEKVIVPSLEQRFHLLQRQYMHEIYPTRRDKRCCSHLVILASTRPRL